MYIVEQSLFLSFHQRLIHFSVFLSLESNQLQHNAILLSNEGTKKKRNTPPQKKGTPRISGCCNGYSVTSQLLTYIQPEVSEIPARCFHFTD